MFRIVPIFIWFFLQMAVLYAATIENLPIRSVEGEKSLINHPEGVAFSPCGNFVAIANSYSNNILFFRTSDCLSPNATAKPVFVLFSTTTPLRYPHDLDFSPNGEHLAIASSQNNLIAIHKRNESGFYDQEPFVIIEGELASLMSIHAIKYSPYGHTLGVCDVRGNQIALFRYSLEKYECIPFQLLQGPIDILDRPDGLAFSSDGKLLAVTSHGVHLLLLYERLSDLEMFDPDIAEIISRERSLCTYPHSVCFHPIDDTLVISSAGGRKTLAVFQKVSDTVPHFANTPSQIYEIFNRTVHLQRWAPEEGGVKGVRFSPDGKVLGLCASDIVFPQRSILFYSVEIP